MSTPDAPRLTKGITHEQRYYLCLKKKECPSMKQSELAAWFKEKYSFSISQPTISHSLKRSAEILSGGLSTPGIGTTRVRKRLVRHPDLELAIYQWVKSQQQQCHQESDTFHYYPSNSTGADGLDRFVKSSEVMELITGPMLLRQAKLIAQEMGIKDTVFCPGWLSRFKVRYGLRSLRTNPNNANIQEADSVNSSPNANVSLPSSPSSNKSLPAMALTSSSTQVNGETRGTQDNNIILSIEVRPSIAVPASMSSIHSSLHQLLQRQHPYDTLITPAHSTPPILKSCTTSGPSQHTITTMDASTGQFSSQQQHQTQHKIRRLHRQGDVQLFQHYRRHPYHPVSLPSPATHNFQQQQQQQQQQTSQSPHHPSLAKQSTSSPPTTMRLDFLQSLPVAPSANGNAFNNPSSSPSSPLSVHQARITEAGESFLSSSSPIVCVSNDSNTMDPTPHAPSIKSDILANSTPVFASQSSKDGYWLVNQLRRYVGFHLQDPTTALQCLETLERELDPTRTRGSIAIPELDDEHS